MARSRSRRLNDLYADYLASPDAALDPLLSGVTALARRMFADYDAAQEFTILVWQALPTLVVTGSFAAFVHRLATWRRLDWFRRARRLALLEQQPPEMVDESGEPLSDGESLDVLWYQAGLRAGRPEPEPDLDGIPDPVIRQTAVLLLQGYTQAECAERIGISPPALRKRLQRYRTALSAPVAA